MILWRVHSPLQQGKEEHHERGERSKSSEELPEASCRGQLCCGRKRHPAQTRRTSELALFVRYAFAAERASAMWTSRCRFA
jgi:hypothetical protein